MFWRRMLPPPPSFIFTQPAHSVLVSAHRYQSTNGRTFTNVHELDGSLRATYGANYIGVYSLEAMNTLHAQVHLLREADVVLMAHGGPSFCSVPWHLFARAVILQRCPAYSCTQIRSFRMLLRQDPARCAKIQPLRQDPATAPRSSSLRQDPATATTLYCVALTGGNTNAALFMRKNSVLVEMDWMCRGIHLGPCNARAMRGAHPLSS